MIRAVSQDECVAFAEFTPAVQEGIVQLSRMLSDGTRLKILLYLTSEPELHVGALCARLGQSQPAVSHHLALLRQAKLIEVRREGKHNFYFICKPYFHLLLNQLFDATTDRPDVEPQYEEFVRRQG